MDHKNRFVTYTAAKDVLANIEKPFYGKEKPWAVSEDSLAAVCGQDSEGRQTGKQDGTRKL